jgi:hypothetical protein
MPTYSISAPDGNTYKIEGPEGASDEQVRSKVLEQFPDAGKRKVSTGEKLLTAAEPALEATGATLGGLAGVEAGPVGVVGGAGLGYGATRAGIQKIKQALGYPVDVPQTTQEAAYRAAKDVATGAAFEAGGQMLGPILGGIKSGYRALFPTGETKAAKMVGQALGDNLPKAREILRQASGDLTASQALAAIDPKTGQTVLNAPTAQALLQRAQARDPEFFTSLFGKQEAQRLLELQKIAGGVDQTAARAAQEEMKKALNERLIPVLQGEMNAANIGGQMLPTLRSMEATSAENAAKSVEDVRRMVAAGERAGERAKTTVTVPGQPRVPGRYTYMGELVGKADQVASDAAKGSLRFGQARDFAKAAREDLEAAGVKELTGDSVVASINRKLSDPKIAGNRDIEAVLKQVSKDIQKWSKNGGVIDAWALDSIRKNSVNSAIQKLYPAASSQSNKALAAKVVESIKPAIIDAVEDAGGTGYRKYLTDYATSAQKIDQKKLGATLLDLYQRSPKEFVRWVEGNAPEKVEDIFGPGSYNIFKELSPETQATLQRVAGDITREDIIKEQAKAGGKRFEDILQTNLSFFRRPHILSRKATVMNTVLDHLEGRVSKKTMNALTKAAKSSDSMEALLSKLDPGQRFEAQTAINRAGLGAAAGPAIFDTGNQ